MEKDIKITEENVVPACPTAETASAEIKKNAATDLGKFKSVDALLCAYRELEAEFTRRSQRLKELEGGNKACLDGGEPSRAQVVPEVEPSFDAVVADDVRRAVIEDYLKTVSEGKSIPLIVGGVSTPAPKNTPKTVKEAGALVRGFLK